MIRLVLILCGGLYFGLLILGEDHGQKRYGLMLADQQPKATPSPQPAPEVVKDVVYIPARTVMEPTKVAAAPVDPPVVSSVAPLVTESAPLLTATDTAAPAALPEPDIPGGTLFTVASRQVNVRQGPGKTFAVVGSLTKGEQVLVVLEENPVKGWSRVRLEGDGMEGYIASSLLTPAP